MRTRSVPTKTEMLRCAGADHRADFIVVTTAEDPEVGAPRRKTARARAIREAKGAPGSHSVTVGGDNQGRVTPPLRLKVATAPLRSKIQLHLKKVSQCRIRLLKARLKRQC